jgi:two-component system NtrC family sensor kinase
MRTDQATRDATVHDELRRVRALLEEQLTGRETTARALEESEERYRSLFDRAAFGIYRSTPEGRFVEANPALIRMLGYESLDELRALDLATDVYRYPEDRAALFDAVEHDAPEPWVEVEWKRKDGTFIQLRISARIVRDDSGRILHCDAIAENITERRRKEELLRRHERLAALGTTLAGVAHELNNPLAAIKGFAQLLLRNPEAVDQRNALETIHHETDRATRIVRDLLVFARRQESQERQVVDLNQIVSYILTTRRYAMETRGIACRVDVAPEPACVLADAVQLEQVVLNLVLNAEQALAAECDAPASESTARRRDARMRVVIATTGEQVSLMVEDNGPGIAEDDLDRIWDPFWTTKAEGEGTGLGLSVVHAIVTGHGGTVEAEGAPERGLRVTVRLPNAEAAAAALVQDLVQRAGPRGDADGADDGADPDAERTARTPLDILLVDDEPSILGFLREFLESRGHAVLVATDGEQALRLAELARFDVVICDLRMPGLGGDEVIQRMRRLDGFSRTRFIVSTGDTASARAARRIAALRPDAVLLKPYDVEALRRVIEQARH